MDNEIYKRKVEVYFSLSDEIGIVLEGTQVEFDIVKKIRRQEVASTVKIYNLSEKTIGQIKGQESVEYGAEGPRPYIILKAGYEKGGFGVIFQGPIESVNTTWKGSNRVTTLEVTNLGPDTRNAKNSISISADTSVKAILLNVIGTLKDVVLDPESLIDSINSARQDGKNLTMESGMVLTGNAVENLNMLVDAAGLGYYIDNGEVRFTYKEAAPNVRELSARYISPATGLIGSPKALSSTEKTGENHPDATSGGAEFTVLLDPTLRIGEPVYVDSREVQGTFILHELHYRGSLRGPRWEVACKGRITDAVRG